MEATPAPSTMPTSHDKSPTAPAQVSHRRARACSLLFAHPTAASGSFLLPSCGEDSERASEPVERASVQFAQRGLCQGQRSDAQRGDIRRDNVAPRAVPRPNVVVSGVAPRYEPRYQPHYESHYAPRYEPRYYGSRSDVRPYQFRPRFSIGFGIFAGDPVPYSYYAYPYPVPVYGDSTPREVIVGADSNAYGGITFEMTPYEADIYVDGTYAGHVSDFDGTRQPLTLTAGTHQIEVVAPGYQTLSFDVNVQPGQVIPYRGDLQR